MNIAQLLFDDDGVITRKQWWVGTCVLMATHALAGYLAFRFLGARGLDRAVMLFISIVILVPFYAINAKRFRFIGRAPGLALVGGILPALAALSSVFLGWRSLDIALGLLLMVAFIWYVVDLGLIAHSGKIDVSEKAA
jgi:uncharacterized membrane protein YhaH (DUF805 family)